MKTSLNRLLPLCLLLGTASAAFAANMDVVAPQPQKPAAQAMAAPSTTCGDDPRLSTSIVEILSGTEPVSPPITITPETFLDMDPEVLQRLAGQMLVCPDNPFLKSGKTMKKVSIDFQPLWERIRKAAASGDFAAVKALRQSFGAKAMAPNDLMSLFTSADLPQETLEKLCAALDLQVATTAAKPLITRGRPLSESLDLVDIFYAVGGKSAENAQVVMWDSVSSVNEDQFKKLPKGVLLLLCYEKYEFLSNKVRRVGMTPITYDQAITIKK